MKPIRAVLFPHVISITIGLLSAGPTVARLDLDSAVGLWFLDEGDGDVAEDSSGTGNDGDLIGRPTWVDGLYGKALEFDGATQYVDIPDPVDLPVGSDPRTLSLSFKWSEVSCAALQIMGYGTNAPGRRLGVALESCNPKNLGMETVGFAKTFDWDGDTDWHTLTIAYPEDETGSAAGKVYFDGAVAEAVERHPDQPINTAGGPLAIGCLPEARIAHFNGIIDEVVIFPEELSAADIKAIAKTGLKGAAAVSPSSKAALTWGSLKAL